MVLLRLQGCAVGCPFCDTKETWDVDPASEAGSIPEALGTNERYAWVSPSEINRFISVSFPSLQWVLLTGGEPAQYPLKPLTLALHDGGHKVALETSGTELGHEGAGIDWVCVSPKLYMPGKKRVLPAALSLADEIKFVIGRERDLDYAEQLLTLSSLKPGAVVCLQPMSLDPKATQLCIQTVQDKGWRLSLQLHKFISQR